jgi:ribosomal protein L30E
MCTKDVQTEYLGAVKAASLPLFVYTISAFDIGTVCDIAYNTACGDIG